MLNPCNRFKLTRFVWIAVELLGNSFLRMLLIRVDFPEPDTPVTAMNFPSGKRAVTFCRLFSRAPVTSIKRPLPTRRSSGTGMARLPDKVLACDRLTVTSYLFGRTCRNNLPTKTPAPGPTSIR